LIGLAVGMGIPIGGRIWPYLPDWVGPRLPNKLWPLDVHVGISRHPATMSRMPDGHAENPFSVRTVVRRGRPKLVETKDAPPKENGNG